MTTTRCPTGCGRASRLPSRPHAKASLCQECYDAKLAAHNTRWRVLRSRDHPEGVSARALTHDDRRAWFKDLPAAEIERRFQAAKAAIRSRR
jgi:hypothetical protein